ncbi:hypothetical protein DFR67_102371 [Williamsia limnetica]|uniref:Uncharacterized protein n=1 Tax=Williamsia limnetica TaxID=882452 RepID=A0A318RQL9_WILLI|nr:hypothetical protein [Williamsia limnetica]PYE20233.1 hypothetical protein DFR67_102371 [Williamsia limnetica]
MEVEQIGRSGGEHASVAECFAQDAAETLGMHQVVPAPADDDDAEPCEFLLALRWVW